MSVLARRVSGGKPLSGRVKVKGNFCVRDCFKSLIHQPEQRAAMCTVVDVVHIFRCVDNMKGGHFAYQKLDGIADILALTFQFLYKTPLGDWLSANLDDKVFHVTFLKE
jgi:hypothetical protein